jgi:hypothetical protein
MAAAAAAAAGRKFNKGVEIEPTGFKVLSQVDNRLH